jgi:hypothetical protein
MFPEIGKGREIGEYLSTHLICNGRGDLDCRHAEYDVQRRRVIMHFTTDRKAWMKADVWLGKSPA